MNPTTHFEKFLAEHNEFIKSLANELNAFKNETEVIRLLRSVLHTFRERLTLQHSFHVLASLPAFLKLYYIEGWKYYEKPARFHSTEEFYKTVEKEFADLGGKGIDNRRPTGESVNIVFRALRKYLNDSGVKKIMAELPRELHPMLENNR